MTIIPGTNYQISGNNILSREGQEVTPQQFLDKVQSKEISLTEDSLKVLEGHVGPDMMQSLRSVSGFPSPPGTVQQKLTDTEHSMNDIYALMRLMAQISQQQRDTVSTVRQTQTGLQLDAMKQSLEEQKTAAVAREWSGILSGAFSMGAGLSGIGGGMNGTQAGMQIGDSVGKLIEGTGKIITTLVDKAGSDNDSKSKEWDIESKRMEDMSNESRDLLDNVRETHAKVKETLQALQNSENETQRAILRM